MSVEFTNDFLGQKEKVLDINFVDTPQGKPVWILYDG